MPTEHKLRIKDKGTSFYKNRNDFLIRKFGLNSLQMARFMGAAVLLGGAFLLFGYNLYQMYSAAADMEYNSSGYSMLYAGCVMALIIGIVLYVDAKQIKEHKDALDATEFLNALFASVINHDQTFSLIAAQSDFRILYLSRGFQQIFPEVAGSGSQTVRAVIDGYGASGADYNPLLQAIEKNEAGEWNLSIRGGAEKATCRVNISVEPIERPAGFLLVRGKLAA